MSETVRIAVRGTNWLGDSVIAIPAVRALRALFPGSPITMLAPANLACLWELEGSADRVVPVPRPAGLRGARTLIAALRRDRYDLGVLLPNSFSSALLFFLGGVRRRVGYATDGRGLLLTSPVPVPRGKRLADPRNHGGHARRGEAGDRAPAMTNGFCSAHRPPPLSARRAVPGGRFISGTIVSIAQCAPKGTTASRPEDGKAIGEARDALAPGPSDDVSLPHRERRGR